MMMLMLMRQLHAVLRVCARVLVYTEAGRPRPLMNTHLMRVMLAITCAITCIRSRRSGCSGLLTHLPA